jgi:tetratricopeptide (TPR) repeat protein
MQQQYEPLPDADESRSALVAAEHAVRQADMPRSDCARTLGAARFAGLWSTLAEARSNRADHRGAVSAFRRALECQPRDVSALTALAAELKWARELTEARTLLERALTIAPQSTGVRRQLGEIDFIEQRWADALAHYRFAITRGEATQDSLYAEVMFHLAQRRAGIARPEVPARPKKPRADEDSDEDAEEDAAEWPTPILEALRGTRTEASLLEAAQDDSSYPSPQERLCEALFYIGQERLARGETETARRYFAAVVNTRVLYFVEHHLALMELQRIGAPP